MFRLNLKIALRSLFRNKVYAAINIGGLAIGLTSCLLLLLYAGYEWGYDRQFKNSPHIYQAMINLNDQKGEVIRTINQSQNVMLAALKEEFSEVLYGARITDVYKRLVANGQESLKLDSRYVDPDFLKLFDYHFISGNPTKALNDPNSIVLTETAAKRIFGTTDVLNQKVRFENQVDLKVTGVIKDLPTNITYGFESLTTFTLYENLNQWPKKPNWGSHDYYTLIKLNENTDIEAFNIKLKGFVGKHFAAAKEDVFIYPLIKLHLYGTFLNGKSIGGNIRQVQLFVGLAIGILLIACINFMNLATASTQGRAKEIGVKKTMGASRSNLVFQFMLESFILTLIGILLSIILLEFSLPMFNRLLGIEIVFDYLNPTNWILIFSVLVITGFISGSYPSFYLSGFNVIQSLKKSLNFKKGYALTFRQVLVVIQFGFSVVLIVATITIYKQIQFIKNMPLGYRSNGLLEVAHEGLLYEKFNLLKTRLLSSGAVVGVTQSSGSISNKNSSVRGLGWVGMSESDKMIDFDQIYTTYDFTKTVKIRLLAGRDFDRKFASDTAAILLSKKAVEVMHLKRPVGTSIVYQGTKRNVVGVFDDIVWDNPSKVAAPMVIAYADISDVITMRLNPDKSLSESTSIINKLVKELNPNFPVEIKFIDGLNEIKLKNEKILGTLANLFGCLAIFISCLGLFGLSSFSTAQRIKEVSIRKILGASITELMTLLSLSFLKLIFIAIVIALPVAYYIMNNWLMHFELRTSLNLWVFMATATLTLVISILTITWQTYRAAKTNAVDALKYE
ncbi:ABC transporter permease [Pedobacter alluvionis]|uniref:ABC transporter permease n=1 Tax=Pedobacter alluvionis TaxID=475253 RepID=A0A497YA89_9SPHI|nr:ABC transporter permease [Pedobacter alluvionis]RLJ80135.1 ABC-type lipoprotein release transport system permease subunit [Pedobacter alluvionis]TFB31424.1 ABC transporter permease [Pedobacter alluvionis]